MDITAITDLIFQQGIWCVLFCYMFYTYQKKSDERESNLTEIIKSHDASLKEITSTLKLINTRLDDIEENTKQ